MSYQGATRYVLPLARSSCAAHVPLMYAHTPYAISEFGPHVQEILMVRYYGAVEWATAIHLGRINSIRCLLSGYSDFA